MSYFAKVSAAKAKRFKYSLYGFGMIFTGLAINYSFNKVEITNRHRLMLLPNSMDQQLGQIAEKQVLNEFGKLILPRESNRPVLILTLKLIFN